MFFFDWLAAQVRDAFLRGINQAIDRLNAAAAEQPAAPPVVVQLHLLPVSTPGEPAPPADDADTPAGNNNGKARKRSASV